MIEVRDLTKYYGPTLSVDRLSFSVPQGEVLGFLGPNGAGKSTTMRMLTGLARPTAGSARIGGHDVHADNDAIRRLIGFCPEKAPVYGDMTLQAYLEFMAGIRGLKGHEARREAERVSALLNLVPERRRLVGNLSKGTRQRAAIAQALLGSPPVLILDEPTVGLDPSQINDVRELIRSMAGKCTVILSTHILPEVEMTCSRIVIISNGHIVAQGTPAELIAGETAEFIVTVRAEREAFEKLLRGIGAAGLDVQRAGEHWRASFRAAKSGADPRAEIARQVVAVGWELIELRTAAARLEDVFLRAVGKR